MFITRNYFRTVFGFGRIFFQAPFPTSDLVPCLGNIKLSPKMLFPLPLPLKKILRQKKRKEKGKRKYKKKHTYCNNGNSGHISS